MHKQALVCPASHALGSWSGKLGHHASPLGADNYLLWPAEEDVHQQGLEKGLQCGHLSLVRAPNPVSFEAAVQEQQQQLRRRQQQQLEVQRLSAELTTVLSPDASAQCLSILPAEHVEDVGPEPHAPQEPMQAALAAAPRSRSQGPASWGPGPLQHRAWLVHGSSEAAGAVPGREQPAVSWDLPVAHAASSRALQQAASGLAPGDPCRHVGRHMRAHSEELMRSRAWASMGAAEGRQLAPGHCGAGVDGLGGQTRPGVPRAFSTCSSSAWGGQHEVSRAAGREPPGKHSSHSSRPSCGSSTSTPRGCDGSGASAAAQSPLVAAGGRRPSDGPHSRFGSHRASESEASHVSQALLVRVPARRLEELEQPWGTRG